jgi:hypothetical protein
MASRSKKVVVVGTVALVALTAVAFAAFKTIGNTDVDDALAFDDDDTDLLNESF